MSLTRELPLYQCHKKVHALKLKSVSTEFPPMPGREGLGGALLEFEEPGYAPLEVDAEWVAKNKPQAGGYYVVYEDGYTSYSPAKAFEDGYTLLTTA